MIGNLWSRPDGPGPLVPCALVVGRVLYLLFAAAVVVGEAAWAVMSPAPADVTPFVKVTQTSQDLGQRLTPVGVVRFTSRQPSGVPVIHVSDSVRYQRIVGVGAAMTDSSAWLMYTQLPPYLFKETMKALFAPAGIHLGFIRVPMGASDFSARGHPYTYDDHPPGGLDPSLAHFSIAHDRAYILPALREALMLNPSAAIIATPWTPPDWMKIYNNLGNSDNASYLLPSDYGALADYFVKFLRGYAQANVPVAAVTAQNEPGQGTWYPGLNLPEWAESSFIADYLKPALRRARLKTAIFGYDSTWSNAVPPYVNSLVTGPAAKDLAGIAFHCYYGTPTVMSTLHSQQPKLQQWVTECTSQTDPIWFPAELEIASLRNWASAVALWNLALNPAGGPVQAPNTACHGCTGVVTVDERTHQVSFGAPYFQLGQVSKFLKPGAVRIGSNHFVSYSAAGPGSGLDDVAFLNPDGSEALVAYNNTSAPARFAVVWRGQSFSYKLPAGAMATFTWRAQPTARAGG
jgi:glucosylceramidase